MLSINYQNKKYRHIYYGHVKPLKIANTKPHKNTNKLQSKVMFKAFIVNEQTPVQHLT